jgi:hypothetical protein
MDQEAQPKSANSVRSIFIRSKSNEGIIVPLKDFPGDNWMRVRGIDSDAVQAALRDFYRNKATDSPEGAKTEGRGPFEDLTVIAAMISEWSFDEPPTGDLLRETLEEVPGMKVAAVNAGLERANFLPQSAKPSLSTQGPASG